MLDKNPGREKALHLKPGHSKNAGSEEPNKEGLK